MLPNNCNCLTNVETEPSDAGKFVSEARLVETFLSKLENCNCLNIELSCLNEFDCSNGIADIVISSLRKDWKENSDIGKVRSQWTYALKSLPYRRIFTTDYFVELTGVTRNSALGGLRHFVEAGFCQKKGNGKWIKLYQPKPVVRNILALEAKLTDWKRALKQASRYLDYAHQSWVVLDEYAIKPAQKNIKEFQRLNIGLSSISTNGEFTIYHTPSVQPPKFLTRFWQANSQIAAELV